jgi:hypothetical protein
MILTYNSPINATIFDVCLQTYGSLDNLHLLITDNNITNINTLTTANQSFIYDYDLVVDYSTVDTLRKTNIQIITGDRYLNQVFAEPPFLLTETPEILDTEDNEDFVVE